MEREKGFEPSTSTLARLHSTAELLPHPEHDGLGLLARPHQDCQAQPIPARSDNRPVAGVERVEIEARPELELEQRERMAEQRAVPKPARVNRTVIERVTKPELGERKKTAVTPAAPQPWRSLPAAKQVEERYALGRMLRAVDQAPTERFRLGFEYEGSNLDTALHYFRPPAHLLGEKLQVIGADFLLSEPGLLTKQGQNALKTGHLLSDLPVHWHDLVNAQGTRRYIEQWQKEVGHGPVVFTDWEPLPTLPAMFKPQLSIEKSHIYEFKTQLYDELDRNAAKAALREGHETLGKAPQHTHVLFDAPESPETFQARAAPWLQQRSFAVALETLLNGSAESIGEMLIDDHHRRSLVADPTTQRGHLRLLTTKLDPVTDAAGKVHRFFSIEVRGNTPEHVAAFNDVLGQINSGFGFELPVDKDAWSRFASEAAPRDHFSPNSNLLTQKLGPKTRVVYAWASNDRMEETMLRCLDNPRVIAALRTRKKVSPYLVMLPAMPWEELFPGKKEVFAEALRQYNDDLSHAGSVRDLGLAFEKWEAATGCVTSLLSQMQRAWPSLKLP